ncbi:endonuclease NucS, partial [Thermoproteota archaeon]
TPESGMDSKIEYINYALKNGETVVFSADCEVAYSGRAEAFLPAGERLVIIKNDKTLLIHQPEGNAPVNYMKPGATHKMLKTDEGVFLKSQNLALKEFLDVKINKIHFVNSHAMQDGQKLQLAGSEKDMAEMLYKNPSMIEEGFVPVAMEEQTKYGFIDVLGNDASGNLVVVECKRYSADLNAVQQLRRYVEKIKESKGIDNVRGILAAPKITGNSEQMLLDWGFKFVSVEPPKYFEKYNADQKTLSGF